MPGTISLVLDANWYVSACISSKPRRTLCYKILKNPVFRVFYSEELLREFDGVISRKKFAKIIKPNQVIRFKYLILMRMQKSIIGTVPQISRGDKDNYLLAICEKSKADFLVTGDKVLLVLEKYLQTAIVTMSHFLQIIPFLEEKQ